MVVLPYVSGQGALGQVPLSDVLACTAIKNNISCRRTAFLIPSVLLLPSQRALSRKGALLLGSGLCLGPPGCTANTTFLTCTTPNRFQKASQGSINAFTLQKA